ncbi:hypothetical protein ABPG74_016179 [Tetrahymena malaccensis]
MTENNTESEFFANKNQKSERSFNKKWIVDDRSNQIKQGLQGDSDLKVSINFDEVAQDQISYANQSSQIQNTILNQLERSQMNQVSNSCNKYKNFSQFQTSDKERRQYKRSNFNIFKAKNLIASNLRIQSQLKMDLECQSFFNSGFYQSNLVFSNIQVEEPKQQGYQNENTQLCINQLNEFNYSVNNFEQVSLSKRQIQIDQQFINSSKNQIQNIADRVSFDQMQKSLINDGNQLDKEYDSYLGGITQEEISFSNFNSQGDVCNKNDGVTSNSKISIHKRKKKSTILKHSNYIDNIQADKIQPSSNNQIEQESINLSANLINDSHYTQDQRYHKYLPSIVTLQHSPDDKKKKRMSLKPQENKIIKLFQDDLQNDFKNELSSQSQLSMMSHSSKGNKEKTTSLVRNQKIQKLQRTLDGDYQLQTIDKQQSMSTVQQKLFYIFFDKMKNYKYYFTHNNSNLIIKDYNFKLRCKSKYLLSTVQNQVEQNNYIKNKQNSSKLIQINSKNQQKSDLSILSYGISTKNCCKYPIIYKQNS